ncbi:bifunctional metallophosphatase/5'-nucleotidase [Erythrobacter sp. LQ02-29]|uniref:bifunctional metallophosphatase/5'-nucleotidase n=1 Tax=Erythrobacter sp. LQ02-29 TaxID=2920384 RepID=UPI001F4EDBEE|nr:bifunctional metallophosphatase/5'-nucleotidase [Erythrobacter sp. LQ02-29]MCP9223529.1 bifunctional metallophosphatase/5'-nucleotidase [Erythrobacter sp. LQ02-29]
MSVIRIVLPIRALVAAGTALTLAACATVAPTDTSATTDVQLLALNDFHGNLEAPQSALRYRDANGLEQNTVLGGGAQMATRLEQLRQGHKQTITVAAGDLIGASPLISAYYLDEPTVKALTAMKLDLASVGNHEFDRSINELQRIQAGGCEQYTARQPCALEPFGGAGFTYLAGNTVDDKGRTLFPGSAMRSFGDIRIGFIGLTLKETGNLTSAEGTRGYRFTDEAEAANRFAAGLTAQGADAIVLLIHQGGDVTDRFQTEGCKGLTGPIVDIADRLDPSIGLVVSGHTHEAYACRITASDGTVRTLTSAGRYAAFVTDIDLRFDTATKRVVSIDAKNIPVPADLPKEAKVAAIVDRYAAAIGPVGNRAVGTVSAGTGTERDADCMDGAAEDFIADAQLFSARAGSTDGADVAFINSGGVRTNFDAAGDGTLTYGEIFSMQPFGNSVEILELTGAQLTATLESQFCDADASKVCGTLLVPSANASYLVTPGQPIGSRVTAFRIDGQTVAPDRTYRVAVNNFLAAGGDGFTGFADGKSVGSGGIDVDAVERYLADGSIETPRCGRVRRAD